MVGNANSKPTTTHTSENENNSNNTTQKHIHLLNFETGEWIVKGTTNKERANQLLEADFTYQLTAPDSTMLFRKPK